MECLNRISSISQLIPYIYIGYQILYAGITLQLITYAETFE